MAGWYTALAPEALAYQATKYVQRNGWSHRDALRLAHPKAADPLRNALYAYLVGKSELPEGAVEAPWAYLHAVQRVNDPATPLSRGVRADHRAPAAARSAAHRTAATGAGVGGAARADADDGDDPQPGHPHARGRARPRSAWTHTVAERLRDQDWLHKARIHPVQVLAALKTYACGHGARGQHSWTPEQRIVDALDAAFYLTFDNVQPTGKRLLLAVDVSGSMGGGASAACPG